MSATSASIFDAARNRSVDEVRALLGNGVDLSAKNGNGFTALHCAVMGCNTADALAAQQALAIVDMLIKAGAPVNAVSTDGRSVFYLAAEFSFTSAPLKLLIEAGADPDVSSKGIHIVQNAMPGEVQEFVSSITGRPIPKPREPLPSRRLGSSEWRAVKAIADRIFESLDRSGILVLQDAGTTQDDGFSDCAEEFDARGGVAAGLTGCCFYTRQDLNRAKRTGQLMLAFWGAPEGADEDMLRVGRQVVSAFTAGGFTVDWNETASTRPAVLLHDIKGEGNP